MPSDRAGTRMPSGKAGDTETRRRLPLHLCEMLEEEYAALHGPLPPDYPDWTFTAGQVLAPDRLATVLSDPPGAGEDPAVTALGQHARALLAKAPSPGIGLVDRLNALLDEPELYTDAAGALPLRPETVEMTRHYFAGGKMALADDDLRRFNRLLLEDAFPKSLAPVYEVRLDAITAALHETPRAALCLSGGGIRSGTFSLGVLQGLARRKLLDRFNYLSTVSGGGYVGSWLTSWSQRHPDRLAGVVDELAKTDGRPKLDPEPDPLRQLREYSNFASPRVSLVSADLWSFIAIYIRNLLINWAALIPVLLAVLLLPRIAVALLYLPQDVPGTAGIAWGLPLLVIGLLSSALAVFYITINRPSRADALAATPFWRSRRTQGAFLRYSLTPTVVAGACLSTFWAWESKRLLANAVFTLPVLGWSVDLGPLLIVTGVAVYLAAVLVGAAVLRQWPQVADYCAALFTGGGAGLVTCLLLRAVFDQPAPARATLPLGAALYACLSVPAYLLIFFLASTVFVAATSRRRAPQWRRQWFTIEDEDREWLGRLGGWLFIAAIGWAVCSALVLFGPMLLLESPKLLAAAGGLSGLIAVLGGKSALSPAGNQPKAVPTWKALIAEHILTIAAVLSIALIVAGLSLLSGLAIAKIIGRPEAWPPDVVGRQLAILYFAPLWLLALAAVLLLAAGAGAAHAINLNKFSLHGAYRARLIRAFLGASRSGTERKPNPFTGFDPQDNVQMHELRPGLLREASLKPGGLAGLASRLTDPKANAESRAIHDALSLETQRFLSRYGGDRAPSQSLKRNLIEDLNRLLEGPEDLCSLPAIGGRAVSEATAKRMTAAAWGGQYPPPGATAAQTNAELAARLPRHGRSDALLVLNRSILDSLYPGELHALEKPPPPYRLFHVVGTALNLVGGKRLAWQQRRAESFTISPLHCGSLYLGYRRSRTYGGVDGVSLGTAVTISGAAASSNMGYHSSSSAVTFVLTLFNARLGWWLGNPGHAGRNTATHAYPRSSLEPLLLEAFGLTDDTSPYVLLSDGGHFDNLGIYEMVLRRCRLIVAVDGSQDGTAAFDDLGAAVRKIRIDLGIDIVFYEPMSIYPRGHPLAAGGRYCATAKIHYSDVDGAAAPAGLLLYVKPALRGDEPRDVLQYASAQPDFPHQSTADQFFDESQFESYRKLGSHVVDRLCSPRSDPASLAAFIDCVYREHIGQPRPAGHDLQGL